MWLNSLIAIAYLPTYHETPCTASNRTSTHVKPISQLNPHHPLTFNIPTSPSKPSVFIPLDVLNILSTQHTDQLPPRLFPRTKPASSMKSNSCFSETHTFATDVLIVHSGIGTRAAAIAFVGVRYPRLRYLVTVCGRAG